VKNGILTRRVPTSAEQNDIQFGWDLAKEIGRLDVGQSVAIKEKAALAVEAIEGTEPPGENVEDLCGLSLYADQRSFFGWPFKIRTIATIVFQFRVVAGTPNNLSTWPR
jgi:hypothetical protein